MVVQDITNGRENNMPRNKNTRAAQGTGTIRKKTVTRNGKPYEFWEARYTVGRDPGTGKQIQRSISGKTQKEVAQKLKAVLRDLDTGLYTEPSKMTVGQWLDTWLSEYVEPSCKPLTLSTYESRIRTRLKPALGSIKLTELSTTQIQTFCNDLIRKEGLSPKTVKNTHGILHKALAQATDLRYILFNPADPVKLPRIERKEISPLTEAEISAFLEEIKKGEPFARLFTVTLFTGMREGEICGLTWDAVDFRNGTITVKQQLQKGKEKGADHYLISTKSGKTRTITAATSVMQVLKEQLFEQRKQHLQMGLAWKNQWNLVFTQEDGGYIPPQSALKHFKKVAERIGRPDARFHDLRHTYAVASLQEGDDVKTVQQNLGHATAAFTLDVYGHVSEKMKQESAARMERFIEKIKA